MGEIHLVMKFDTNRDLNSVHIWRKMDAAELLLEADDVDTALSILEKAAADNYAVENLHYLRAMIYLGRNEHQKAKEAALMEFAYFPKSQRANDILDSYEFMYRCPVCRNQVADYLPLPSEYTKQLEQYEFPYTLDEFETLNHNKYICPNCGATDRDRLYALFIDRITTENPVGNKINTLDFAPSKPFANYIDWTNNFKYRSADWLIDSFDEKVDIMNMHQFAENTFDTVICSHVLEHVSDDLKAIRECKRVLKSGGWAIFMSPICLTLKVILEDASITNPIERWKYFGQDDHVRLYSKAGFKERLTAGGFSIKEYGLDYFGIEAIVSAGLSSRSVLYVGR